MGLSRNKHWSGGSACGPWDCSLSSSSYSYNNIPNTSTSKRVCDWLFRIPRGSLVNNSHFHCGYISAVISGDDWQRPGGWRFVWVDSSEVKVMHRKKCVFNWALPSTAQTENWENTLFWGKFGFRSQRSAASHTLQGVTKTSSYILKKIMILVFFLYDYILCLQSSTT